MQRLESGACPRSVLNCVGSMKISVGSPGSIPQRSQLYSPLLEQNLRVKTMGERDNKVVCRWRQLTLAE